MPVLLRRALLSVSDKTSLLDLARELERRGVRSALIDAVAAATRRAIELGK